VKRVALLLCSGVVLLGVSPAAVAADRLSGSFRTRIASGQLAGTWVIKFSHGNFRVSYRGDSVVRGKYRVSGRRVRLTDKSGRLACRGSGTYRFRRSGRGLDFTRVSERLPVCAGRATVLAQHFVKIG
jgi:hypothetical protein